MKFERNRLWLCLPFLVIFLVDAGITLACQPSQYWAGDRTFINEMFPLFAWGLAKGPSVFALLCAMWVLAFSVVIMVIPRLLAEILSLSLVSGHTWGTMTWLVNRIGLNYHLCLLFFVLSATVYVVCVRMSRAGRKSLVGNTRFSKKF